MRRAREPIAVFVCFAAACLAFAFWAPRYDAPDEPAHVIKVDGVLHGEFLGREGPAGFDWFTTDRDVPAFCRNGQCLSQVGRYPPLWYVAIAPAAPLGLRAMRALHALYAAVLLTAAFVLARGFTRVGVLLATTPMAYYLAGVVNPNGLEVAAALCLWVAARERRWGWAILAFALVANIRGLGPLIALAALGIAGWRAVPRRVWGWCCVTLVPAGVWWLVSRGHNWDAGSDTLAHALREQGRFVGEMIGVFGSLDEPLPHWLHVTWIVPVVALLAVARFWRSGPMLAVVALVVVVPTAVQVLGIAPVGAAWQGRYSLPIAAGLPVLAAAEIAERRRGRVRGRADDERTGTGSGEGAVVTAP